MEINYTLGSVELFPLRYIFQSLDLKEPNRNRIWSARRVCYLSPLRVRSRANAEANPNFSSGPMEQTRVWYNIIEVSIRINDWQISASTIQHGKEIFQLG